MYQEVILDHYKHPHHRGLREPFGAEVHHVNPTCGDEVTLRVALSDDGETVADISYDGQGCSISQASTSVLTDQVIGQSVGEALKTVAAFTEMISVARHRRRRRRCDRRRHRVRRCREVPGAGEMRAAGLDGVQGRAGAGQCRRDWR